MGEHTAYGYWDNIVARGLAYVKSGEFRNKSSDQGNV